MQSIVIHIHGTRLTDRALERGGRGEGKEGWERRGKEGKGGAYQQIMVQVAILVLEVAAALRNTCEVQPRAEHNVHPLATLFAAKGVAVPLQMPDG